MTRIYMVRHGKAASGWDGDLDPGLDDLGRAQSEAVAQELKGVGPLPILSSPLKRTQETAVPLAKLWNASVSIAPEVAEIPSPTPDLKARTEWLRAAMAGEWSALDQQFIDWRDSVLAYAKTLENDCVIFSHFIAINVLVGHCEGSDRVVCFAPDNCSVTAFDIEGDQITLVSKGREADTVVR